jgi:hypothetical protein
MNLIYRGQTFSYNARSATYRQSFAINWRYQVEGEKYSNNSLPTVPYQQPFAINWRWQVPTE